MKGKLITIYGINNMGKTTHAKRIVKKFQKEGHKSRYLKYPVYDVQPTGGYINKFLRDHNNKQNITEEELQLWFVLNRYQFQPKLEKFLDNGEIVVTEDYIGTGLAWGSTKGANLKWLEDINKHLIKEDLAILIHGNRQISAKEKNHLHESDDELMKKCQKKHLFLAKKYGWKKVILQEKVEDTAKLLWDTVKKYS